MIQHRKNIYFKTLHIFCLTTKNITDLDNVLISEFELELEYLYSYSENF